MGFPENPLKILQLRDHITSSKMVVRGWYMTHFDRRDLLNSKKIGFRNMPGLYVPICEIFRFFWNFRPGRLIRENEFLKLPSPNFFFKIYIFAKFSNGFWNCDTSAPFWYIYIGQTPNSLCAGVFENLVVRFFPYMCISLFPKPLK